MIGLRGMWMEPLFPNARSTSNERSSRNEQEVQHNDAYRNRAVVRNLTPSRKSGSLPAMVDCRSFRLGEWRVGQLNVNNVAIKYGTGPWHWWV
jgi:hypothetical protein